MEQPRADICNQIRLSDAGGKLDQRSISTAAREKILDCCRYLLMQRAQTCGAKGSFPFFVRVFPDWEFVIVTGHAHSLRVATAQRPRYVPTSTHLSLCPRHGLPYWEASPPSTRFACDAPA